MCFIDFNSVADSDLEQQTKLLDAERCNSADRLMFESHSSEEENILNWDPIVEACNKHVTLSQVDSGKLFQNRY